MAHSVVKVTEDEHLNDRLLLVVDSDGTVTPDKETVQSYLNSKPDGADFEVMHVNKVNVGAVDLTLEAYTYIQGEDVLDDVHDQKDMNSSFSNKYSHMAPEDLDGMDEIAKNLYYFRLDHDYTPLMSPKREQTPDNHANNTVDELAETLSLLDGSRGDEQKVVGRTPVRIIRKANNNNAPIIINSQAKFKTKQAVTNFRTIKMTKVISKEKVQGAVAVSEPKPQQPQNQQDPVEEETAESQEDDNDSDYETGNVKPSKRHAKSRSLSSEGKTQPLKTPSKNKTVSPALKSPIAAQPTTPKSDTEATGDKKQSPQKKEKKPPKPIPDDFALFSTPDIIRRVPGGKSEPDSPKIESPRARLPSTETRPIKRLSTEIKQPDSSTKSTPPRTELRKSKDAADASPSASVQSIKKEVRERRTSGEVQRIETLASQQGSVSIQEFHDTSGSNSSQSGAEPQLEPLPNTEDIQSIIGATSAVFNASQDLNQLTESLDLDQSILDNIGTDLISEDILYQVAQSLAGNAELQTVMELSNVDGSLLDSSLAQETNHHHHGLQEPQLLNANEQVKQPEEMEQLQRMQPIESPRTKGTQIVRPDGRVVVIPPIERPTTRSRNRKNQEPQAKQLVKTIHKPLDEEHVSGNELDSASEKDEADDDDDDKRDEDDDEDEDDPDKLWCICNQPHNNRFMICCDTCEEWYHGKCVNVTKAMGQLMENQGKEWICLFCKDATLKRPEAAARRIRKASRTSTDSVGGPKKSIDVKPAPQQQQQRQQQQPACIVCGKPSRVNSIYCSDGCILKHAQGVEKVVVFERSTGKILSGTNAPSAANLDKWLQEHPGFEAVRSTTNKPTIASKVTQSKLKIVKNVSNDGVSLALQKKGINIGVLQHSPKDAPIILNKHINNKKMQISGLKIISKAGVSTSLKTKVIHTLPVAKQQPSTPSPRTPTTPKPSPQTPSSSKEKQLVQQKLVRNKSTDSPSTPSPQPKQENIRENVRKTLFEQLTNRLKMVDDLKLTADEVTSISTEIESQLYKCFGDTSQKYRNKYRSLIFNIKDVKNQTLWRRICEKSINPYQLVRLSSDDLASQELALWREQTTKRQLDMIKKSELELLNCNRQYVFKTHKGEEVFEDDRPKETVDSTEVITSLTAADGQDDDGSSSKGSSSREREKKSSKHAKRDRSRGRSKDSDRSRESRSSNKEKQNRDRHRRSRSRDRSNKEKKRSRSKERHRRSSHKSSKHKKEVHSTTDKLSKKSEELLKQLVDKQILQPLEEGRQITAQEVASSKSPAVESESDHEPTSTVTIPTPPQNVDPDTEESSKSIKSPPQSNKTIKIDEEKKVKPATPSPSVKDENSRSPTQKLLENPIWHGVINMVDVAQISISAHEVSGDCSGLGNELSHTLDIVGRIAPDTVWDYIGKMKCSNSKVISLLRLHAKNDEEQMPYIALYSYLSARKRLGVVKSVNKAVKDFYILPLSNTKPIPQALLPITGPGFEESRPPLLLGIIVRDKRKRPAAGSDTNAYVANKRTKTDVHVVAPKSGTPPRSYTPPPTSTARDPRVKMPLPSLSAAVTTSSTTKKDFKEDDMDEPYSPEDSDPDSGVPAITVAPTKINPYIETSITTQILEPFTNKFDTIPGLEDTSISITSQELQRQMAELDQQIAMEKAVISNMSQDIVSTAGAEIGATALSSIALPSNLQQILDSIKTIGPTNATDSPQNDSSDLTIPLMLPKLSSRTQGTRGDSPATSPTSSTIPLKLPTKSKKPSSSPPTASTDCASDKSSTANSVLSSLTEEDLIRKAAEMLGETQSKRAKDAHVVTYQPASPYIPGLPTTTIFNKPPPATINLSTPPPPLMATPPPPGVQTSVPLPPPLKRSKIDLNQPPIPGLEDEDET